MVANVGSSTGMFGGFEPEPIARPLAIAKTVDEIREMSHDDLVQEVIILRNLYLQESINWETDRQIAESLHKKLDVEVDLLRTAKAAFYEMSEFVDKADLILELYWETADDERAEMGVFSLISSCIERAKNGQCPEGRRAIAAMRGQCEVPF